MAGYRREELIGTALKSYFTEPERAHTGVKLTFAEGEVTNYAQVLRSGSEKGSHAAVMPMLVNSFVMALGVAVGKITISIIRLSDGRPIFALRGSVCCPDWNR